MNLLQMVIAGLNHWVLESDSRYSKENELAKYMFYTRGTHYTWCLKVCYLLYGCLNCSKKSLKPGFNPTHPPTKFSFIAKCDCFHLVAWLHQKTCFFLAELYHSLVDGIIIFIHILHWGTNTSYLEWVLAIGDNYQNCSERQ